MSAQKRETGQSFGRGKEGKIDPVALVLLTDQVRNLLAFHQEIGLNAYFTPQKLQQFFTLVQKAQPSSCFREQRDCGKHLTESVRQSEYHFEKATYSQRPPTRENKKIPSKPTTENIEYELKALSREIGQCRQCSSGNEVKKVFGLGSFEPRLLVVGDYCHRSTEGSQLIWGEEEDAMLWRMMAAIGLEQDSVYVTNAIKCVQPDLDQTNPAVELSCFSYVEKELQILRPRLICTMGDIATRALLKNKAPLARVRGRFHTYRYPQGDVAKVMPTFHPRLLLQYPEMKQATWKDLQAVQKALQISFRTV